MGTNLHFNLGWYTIFELGHRLIELMGQLGEWLSSEVSIPTGQVIAGEFVPGGSITGSLADMIVGGGLAAILFYKVIKFIVDIV